MTYAQIMNAEIVAVGRPPRVALVDGRWLDLRDPANLPAAGWFEVVNVPRPEDTDTHTHTRTIELVDGAPTVVWTEREWTEAEQRARETPDVDPLALLAARLQGDPELWQQPTGAHDAYPPGWVVLDGNGDRWQNTLSVPNVWALDVHGWVNLDAPDLGDEWASGVTYATGDEVTYDGVRYACISGHTSQVGWEPPNVPALWQAI